MDGITTKEAATMLGLTERQIRNMADELRCKKFGVVWIVSRAAVEKEIKKRNGKAKGKK